MGSFIPFSLCEPREHARIVVEKHANIVDVLAHTIAMRSMPTPNAHPATRSGS